MDEQLSELLTDIDSAAKNLGDLIEQGFVANPEWDDAAFEKFQAQKNAAKRSIEITMMFVDVLGRGSENK